MALDLLERSSEILVTRVKELYFLEMLKQSGRRGFTLIELLVVVGIISVLSAIAVPNMMEAQVRAKVSRAKSDMNSVRTSLEVYRVDAGAYPYVGDPRFPSHSDLYIKYGKRLRPLTTPLAYIQKLPEDPFAKPSAAKEMGTVYCYSPGNLLTGAGSLYTGKNYRNTIYSLASCGPDTDMYYGGYCMAHPVAFQRGYNVKGAYDPTNGTVSDGDIFITGSGTLGR